MTVTLRFEIKYHLPSESLNRPKCSSTTRIEHILILVALYREDHPKSHEIAHVASSLLGPLEL